MNKDRMKRIVLILLVLTLLFAVGCSDDASAGAKEITIEVVGADGQENQYVLQTEADTLGQLLDEQPDLAVLDDSDYGRFIVSVDGYEADASANEYWSILKNGEYAQAGADELEVTDGDTITLAIDTF